MKRNAESTIVAKVPPSNSTLWWTMAVLIFACGVSPLAVNVEPASRTFNKDGGGAAIIVTAVTSEAWTASTTATWLNITPTTTGVGNGTVSYLVSANRTANQRSGIITINTANHTVYQNGYEATITPSQATYGKNGGEGTISVSVQPGISWFATNNNTSWITISSGASGSGSAVVSYRVGEHTGIGARTGTMSVAGKVFAVTQNGADIALSPGYAHVDDNSNLILFSVNALASTTWLAVPSGDWITVINAGTGSGDSAVTLAVSANPGYNQRIGTVTVGTAAFTIIQDGNRNPELSIDPPSATAGAAGAFGLLTVWAIPDGPWTSSSDVPWITITEGLMGAGNGNVKYVASANPNITQRSGSVTVTPRPQSSPSDLARDLVGHYPGKEQANRVGRGRNFSRELTFVSHESSVDGHLVRSSAEFSFSFWCNPVYLGRINRLAEFQSSDGAKFAIYAGEDNMLKAHLTRPEKPDEIMLTTYQLQSGIDQQFIGVLTDSNLFTLYLGKTKIADHIFGTTPISAGTNTGRVLFGHMTVPTDGFYAGSIHDIRFYHRSLTFEEVQLLSDMEASGKQYDYYSAGNPRDEQDRILAYTFQNNGLDVTKHGRTIGIGSLLPSQDRFGRIKSALRLNGDALISPNQAGSCTTRDITWQAWMNLDALTACSLIVKRTGPTLEVNLAENGFTLKQQESVLLNIEKVVPVKKWIMVTFVAHGVIWYGNTDPLRRYDCTLYLNDLSIGMAHFEWNGTGLGKESNSDTTVGGFSGYLDDFTIYDKALSADEVAQLYQAQKPKDSIHTVTQTAVTGNLSSATGQFLAAGGTGQTDLTINNGVSWSAQSNVPWITLISAATASGNGTVNYQVEPNGTVYPRDGTLTIAGLTYTVTQKGRNHTVDKDTFSFGPDGGMGIANLSTEAGASWTAIASDNWITVAQGQSGSGPAAVIIITSPYSSPTGYRVGTVTIGGSVIKLTQFGYEASITPLVQEVIPNGGTNLLNVSVPIGAVWEAVSRTPWITLIGGQSQSGSGTLNYIVAANSGAQRSGTIIVAGKEVTINQQAPLTDDTDGDGLPDAWEMQHFGNLSQGPNDDFDHDGVSNYFEWIAGTDPTDPASKPDLSLAIYRAIELNFGTAPGVHYQIEGSDDFQTWVNVGSPFVGNGSAASEYQRIEQQPKKYYRLKISR